MRASRRSADRAFLEDFWRDALGRRSYLRSQVASLPVVYSMYRALVGVRNGPNIGMERMLAEERIDAVVHPTVLEGPFINDLVHWGRSHRKPVILLMNSWDNPSVKSMVIGQADWLVVWGEQTRRHAVEHLGWSSERIVAFGAAQFELYKHRPRHSRAQVLKSAGLDEGKRTLLYAGSSKGLNEVGHLLALEAAAEAGTLPDWQVIYRPHPWRGVVQGEPDFNATAWRRVKLDPQMREYYAASRNNPALMFMPDYAHTHDLLSAVDAVVSPLSTILLEAAMHDRPILAYVPHEEVRAVGFMRNVAQMRFFREFFDRVGGGPCESTGAFIGMCKALMEAAESAVDGQYALAAEYFVARCEKTYGQQLLELVDRTLRVAPAARAGKRQGDGLAQA